MKFSDHRYFTPSGSDHTEIVVVFTSSVPVVVVISLFFWQSLGQLDAATIHANWFSGVSHTDGVSSNFQPALIIISITYPLTSGAFGVVMLFMTPLSLSA